MCVPGGDVRDLGSMLPVKICVRRCCLPLSPVVYHCLLSFCFNFGAKLVRDLCGRPSSPVVSRCLMRSPVVSRGSPWSLVVFP